MSAASIAPTMHSYLAQIQEVIERAKQQKAASAHAPPPPAASSAPNYLQPFAPPPPPAPVSAVNPFTFVGADGTTPVSVARPSRSFQADFDRIQLERAASANARQVAQVKAARESAEAEAKRKDDMEKAAAAVLRRSQKTFVIDVDAPPAGDPSLLADPNDDADWNDAPIPAAALKGMPIVRPTSGEVKRRVLDGLAHRRRTSTSAPAAAPASVRPTTSRWVAKSLNEAAAAAAPVSSEAAQKAKMAAIRQNAINLIKGDEAKKKSQEAAQAAAAAPTATSAADLKAQYAAARYSTSGLIAPPESARARSAAAAAATSTPLPAARAPAVQSAPKSTTRPPHPVNSSAAGPKPAARKRERFITLSSSSSESSSSSSDSDSDSGLLPQRSDAASARATLRGAKKRRRGLEEQEQKTKQQKQSSKKARTEAEEDEEADSSDSEDEGQSNLGRSGDRKEDKEERKTPGSKRPANYDTHNQRFFSEPPQQAPLMPTKKHPPPPAQTLKQLKPVPMPASSTTTLVNRGVTPGSKQLKSTTASGTLSLSLLLPPPSEMRAAAAVPVRRPTSAPPTRPPNQSSQSIVLDTPTFLSVIPLPSSVAAVCALTTPLRQTFVDAFLKLATRVHADQFDVLHPSLPGPALLLRVEFQLLERVLRASESKPRDVQVTTYRDASHRILALMREKKDIVAVARTLNEVDDLAKISAPKKAPPQFGGDLTGE